MTLPVIETARLRLRPFGRDDVDDLHRLWTEPEVRQYLWDDEVITRDRVESLINTSLTSFENHGFGLWAVLPRDEESLIGFCGFWFLHEPPTLELLYGMSPSHWHKGLATEAARAMINYGFKGLALQRVAASTDAANLASFRVMERAGMSFWKRETTNDLDTVYFAISREADQVSEISEGGNRAED
ncbi:MAG: GNAT family N-acetyltransferase [Pyrinomonadaceae bacterium]|nr:GNAT family N-acetyltransferase [Pyrinomonadaceae bacterium]